MQREGIDFIEYYARSMMELADGKPVLDREGEHNKYFYKSIGTGYNSTLNFHLQLWWYNISTSCCW